MNESGDEDRNAPRTDESGGEPSEATPASGPDRMLGLGDPLLDVALEPVTDTLGELVSVDNTPPAPGRTGPGRTPRLKGSAESRSSRDGTGAKSLASNIPSDDYRVESQRTSDEIVVTAELPDVTADELFVGLDKEKQSLVVAVNGAVIAREFYPWEMVEVSSTCFDAPDLEVRLEPAADSTSE